MKSENEHNNIEQNQQDITPNSSQTEQQIIEEQTTLQATPQITPMMRQFFEIKHQNPEFILFFRMGDFYEMFGEDAVLVAELLNIALTKRNRNSASAYDMCGVPHHAYKKYAIRLLQLGYKILICDQLEDPKLTKGLVKRGVTQVLTPATIIEEDALENYSNNFLLTIFFSKNEISCLATDVSTGDILIQQIELNTSKHKELNSQNYNKNALQQTDGYNDAIANNYAYLTLIKLIKKLNIKEIITNDKQRLHTIINIYSDKNNSIQNKNYHATYSNILQASKEQLNQLIKEFKPSKPQIAEKRLLDYFKTKSLAPYNINKEELIVSIDSLLTHLDNSLLTLTLKQPIIISPKDTLELDTNVIEALELVNSVNNKNNSLFQVLNKCKTQLGERLLNFNLLNPIRNIDAINERLNIVEYLLNNISIRETIETHLIGITDLERIISRIINNRIMPHELLKLRSSLQKLTNLTPAILTQPNDILQHIITVFTNLPELAKILYDAIADEPANTLYDGGLIKQGYDEHIDALKEITQNTNSILQQIELRERQTTSIPTLKIGYTKVFGYYIEISKGQVSKVPEHYERKQTLVNAERFTTPELKELEEKILSAKDALSQLEYEKYSELISLLKDNVNLLRNTSNSVALLDFYVSLATIAYQHSYTRPKLNTKNYIKIEKGRHPIIEQFTNQNFVDNDTEIDAQSRFQLITGPNMAGKSTYMRQVALITIMAHIGSFVPAAYAELPICDKIFTRIGASDNILSGESTFMVEMLETSYILHNSTKNSLIILDEIGRGTSTQDGLSIAIAVSEYIIKNIGAITLFSTHYHELIEFIKQYEGVTPKTAEITEQNDQVFFKYKIIDGVADKSYGIYVAELAKMPKTVTERATELLDFIPTGATNTIGNNTTLLPHNTQNNQHTNIIKVSEPILIFDDEDDEVSAEQRQKLQKLEQKLKSLDLNNITPMQALAELTALKSLL